MPLSYRFQLGELQGFQYRGSESSEVYASLSLQLDVLLDLVKPIGHRHSQDLSLIIDPRVCHLGKKLEFSQSNAGN